MKDIAGSRTTYYSLARENLIEKHPKMFNLLLILALIFMTGLAVFLISDILSFGSNSSYKGAQGGFDLQGRVTSVLENDKDILVANSSDDAKGNLSRINASGLSSALDPSNSSRIGNSSRSSSNSKGIVVSNGSSAGSSVILTNNKKDNTNGAIHHTHSSSSSSSSSKSAKEIKGPANLTNVRVPEINQTPKNQSELIASLTHELEMRNISTLYSIGNKSSSVKEKDGSDGKILRVEFKTDLTTKSESISNSGEIGKGTITSRDMQSDSKLSEDIQAGTKDAVSGSSKELIIKSRAIAQESRELAQKNALKAAQESRATARIESQKRLQDAREQQKAKRDKLINDKKNQATQSRAIQQR
jgi:hypothetical protein